MKKIILAALLSFIISTLFPDEIKQLTIAIIPVYSAGFNEISTEYDKLITELLKNESVIQKYNVIFADQINKDDLKNLDKISTLGKNLNVDIIIYGNYWIKKDIISINLTSYDINKNKVLYNRVISLNIQKTYFYKSLKFFIYLFIKETKINFKFNSQEQFKKAIDFSIGSAISPIIGEAKISSAKRIDLDNRIEYKIKSNLNLKQIPASISFSYSYFLNQRFSLGFNILNAYSSGIYVPDPENSSIYESSITLPIYMHSIINSISFRIKNRSKRSRSAFISDIGVFTDIEILNALSKYSTDEYSIYISGSRASFINSYDYFEGNLFIGIGPIVAFGFEGRVNSFSFELLGFAAGAFGWKSTDTLNVIDPLAGNYNLQMGLLLKFNYYKFQILEK